MALMVTGVWIGMVAVSRVLEKKALREANPPEARLIMTLLITVFAAVAQRRSGMGRTRGIR